MFLRVTRFGRALVMIVILAALGGQQVRADWICLPPAFSALSWLFAIGTAAQTLETQSREAGRPSDTDESQSAAPPLCLTDPVALSVWAEPVRKEIQNSQSITVKIYGSFSRPVVSFGFHLDYDQALLNLSQLTVAAQFRPLDSDYSAGVAGLAYPDGASGDRVLLATARFRAKAVGEAEIGLAVTANDPTEGFALFGCGEGDARLTPGSVTIIQREPPPPRPPPPVPEPSSVLCLLAGVGWLRRRRHRG